MQNNEWHELSKSQQEELKLKNKQITELEYENDELRGDKTLHIILNGVFGFVAFVLFLILMFNSNEQ